ncbi:MAG: bifunctional DNA-formamidopyrimidine glycosylase/DNA-(apurinic or apyrimidinic site) lyase [Proteobacteria bacterium]|nr:bifunctional DNA-formamidopyrimidine glycosylase/DNA-(apurinic or apyrimidinic site) lyase [Pseudomonadota bacterium]
MPELPEVEVICRGIRPHLVGRTITAIYHSGKQLRWPVPFDLLCHEMIGHQVIAVSRRAKYLQISLDSGSMLIIHLGMTGNLGFFPPKNEPAKHDHLRFTLDNCMELRYNDSRRFGSIQVLKSRETANLEETVFRTTGPEPFSNAFSPEYLHELAKGKQQAVKVFIMATQVVAGVGNIYASESLFRAGILPTRKVRTISKKDWGRLVSAIHEILQHAIDCGGSTISNFINARQEKGYFQVNFKVYGRQGEPCITCQEKIEKISLGGRASYFCPRCQK